ncbi:MAG: MBL fold metallo-hydrolase [Acidobacteria bacterium]|nr:MBL fold metallo-hydrolase [Acidobacteriota bacterium]
MEITYWGVRGSIPVPSTQEFSTKKYGGNTICLEVRSSDGELIIIDGGTGLRSLGRDMLQQGFGGLQQCKATMFFSHGHWDHIQGFPFFIPNFHKTNTFEIYGFKNTNRSLENHLRLQQMTPNFPVALEEMGAKFHFHELRNWHSIDTGGIKVTPFPLNHPGGCFGFVLDEGNSKFVFATDTEHYSDKIDENILKAAHKANVLVYDAMYTPEEYEGINEPSHKGWGHSTFVAAIDTAIAAEVDELVLFHHDPDKNDYRLDLLYKRALNYLNRMKNEKKRAKKLRVKMAVEGLNQII